MCHKWVRILLYIIDKDQCISPNKFYNKESFEDKKFNFPLHYFLFWIQNIALRLLHHTTNNYLNRDIEVHIHIDLSCSLFSISCTKEDFQENILNNYLHLTNIFHNKCIDYSRNNFLHNWNKVNWIHRWHNFSLNGILDNIFHL